jgi:hypothetical protein
MDFKFYRHTVLPMIVVQQSKRRLTDRIDWQHTKLLTTGTKLKIKN